MTKYAPAYTSMECKQDQEYNDEPYAIFWGVNWTNVDHEDWGTNFTDNQEMIKNISFVRRTKVYKNIDDGERGGAYRGEDDKVLTKGGKWETIDRTKHFILVQAMEHDCGSPEYIKRALDQFLPLRIMPAIMENKSEDHIVDLAKKYMKEEIDRLRYLSRGIIKILLGGGSAPLDKAALAASNPDDRVGEPLVLPLRGDKQELKFSSNDYGTYIYKFNIQSK